MDWHRSASSVRDLFADEGDGLKVLFFIEVLATSILDISISR